MITDKDRDEFTRIVENPHRAKTSELMAIFVSTVIGAVIGGAVAEAMGMPDDDNIEGTRFTRTEAVARLSEAIDRRFPVPG